MPLFVTFKNGATDGDGSMKCPKCGREFVSIPSWRWCPFCGFDTFKMETPDSQRELISSPDTL